MLSCDVLVIGAGPAGVCAALAAVQKHVRVICVDANRTPGNPVRCAEFVPLVMKQTHPNITKFTLQKTSHLETVFPSGQHQCVSAPGLIIDKASFVKEIATQARLHGAVFFHSARATDKNGNIISIHTSQGKKLIKTQVIVGADGPHSCVAGWMGFPKQKCLLGLYYHFECSEILTKTEVYFDSRFPGGYGWVFPRKNRINIGIGLSLDKLLPLTDISDKIRYAKKLLTKFSYERCLELRFATKPLLFRTGWIPVGGIRQTCHERMLLAGDAAGFTHPMSGAGIPQAIISGEMAGKIAAQTALSGDRDELEKYEVAWKELWEDELKRAVEKRIVFEGEGSAHDDTIERCWVTCKGYYRQKLSEKSQR